jgi:hypothetical protein
LIPMVIADIGLAVVAKVARAVLRVALTPVAELLNVAGAFINALRSKEVVPGDDQPLSLRVAIESFEGRPEKEGDFAPILRSAKKVAAAIWTLGLSVLVERRKARISDFRDRAVGSSELGLSGSVKPTVNQESSAPKPLIMSATKTSCMPCGKQSSVDASLTPDDKEGAPRSSFVA